MLASVSRISIVTVALLTVLQPVQGRWQPPHESNDFAFLEPWFLPDEKDRDALAQRAVVVHALPASRKQMSVIAASAVTISPEAFVARVRAIGDAKHGALVAGQFGDPPALDDLARLTVDQGDIDRLRLCRPGECALNLSDGEMSALQLALAPSAKTSAVQDAFRGVVLDRVRRYKSAGLAALPEYHDRRDPVQPRAVFSEILQQIPYLNTHVPSVAEYLERYPSTNADGASSLHWSKVIMNKKAVITVIHIAAFRPRPGPAVPVVLVAAKQVYASRYMNGELALWMLFARGDASPTYLVYVTRSQLDELGGAGTSVKRTVIETRVKREAADAMTKLRDRLERQP